MLLNLLAVVSPLVLLGLLAVLTPLVLLGLPATLSPLMLLNLLAVVSPLVLLGLLAAGSPSVLLGLLADPGPLAAQDGGSLLHGSALLRLVEGGDAVGHRLDDGAATLLQRHRSSTLPRLVRRFGFLGDDDDALVVRRGGDADGFRADDPAAGEAVESRQVQGLL